jgi:hypothetical protein
MTTHYAGSNQFALKSGTELTDGSAVLTFDVDITTAISDLLIDVISDKGCTVDLIRYMDNGQTIEGVPGTQGVVADGGPSGTFIYSDLGCAAIKVTVTKTEAGTSSGFAVSVRGQA